VCVRERNRYNRHITPKNRSKHIFFSIGQRICLCSLHLSGKNFFYIMNVCSICEEQTLNIKWVAREYDGKREKDRLRGRAGRVKFDRIEIS